MPNKKSQLEDLFPLLILIVFLLFAFIFASCTNQTRSSQIQEDTSFQALVWESSQLLFTYLKIPTDLDTIDNSDMADALNLYYLTEDDEDLLEQIDEKTMEFFSTSDLDTEDAFWSLEITPPSKLPLIIMSSNLAGSSGNVLAATAIVPTNNPDEVIKLELFVFNVIR